MIELESITHAYEKGEPVLRDISFRAAAGEKIVLFGSNGTGKTTLLKILNGLILPESGTFRYKGTPIDGRSLGERDFHRTFRREVVYLFQNPDSMMFNPTVYDEIAFGPRQLGLNGVDEKVRRWAGELGLSDRLDKTPFHLSGGEKKKVCLAALLALEPEMLLLDEPAANLDPRTTGWLVDFLQELEITLLATTHNLGLGSELGDRAIVLSEQHEVIYDGPVPPLLKDREKLIEANLMHIHRHRHDEVEHRHYHTHDWE